MAAPATNLRPPDDSKKNPDLEEDTILEDMISFKLGQEVTVNKIIFEDSDEEFPEKDMKETLPLSAEKDMKETFSSSALGKQVVPPCINNVIILGKRKASVETNDVSDENDNHTVQTAKKEETAEIGIAKENERDLQNCDALLIKSESNEVDKLRASEANCDQKETKTLGPDEFVYIPTEKNDSFRMIAPSKDLNAEPVFNTTTTANDQPDPKRCKKVYPRTKVTSKRVIKKFPGKMDAMRKCSEEFNKSKPEDSATPVTMTATTTIVANDNASTCDNASHTNFNEPYVLPMLTTVIENVLVVFPSLCCYMTARKTIASKTDERYKARKNEFEKVKLHCFSLSYTTTLYIIVPNKSNAKFMKDFYNLAEKLALERGTLQFSASNFEILCHEMIEFTEFTQRKMSVLHAKPAEMQRIPTSPSHANEKNSALCKILQSSPKPVAPVPTVETKIDSLSNCPTSVVKFKTGAPGKEIEITYNVNQIPQDPAHGANNQSCKINSSTPISTQNFLQEKNMLIQPRPVNNNNQHETKHRSSKVTTSTFNLNTNLSYLPRAVPSTDRLNYSMSETNRTSGTNMSNVLYSNKPTNEMPNTATAIFPNAWKPVAPVNTMSPQLNYMESYNNYVQTRPRVENTSCNNITSKPTNQGSANQCRLNQTGTLPLLVENQNHLRSTTNLPISGYSQSPYAMKSPPPYYSLQNQHSLSNFNHSNNFQMPQIHQQLPQNISQVQYRPAYQNTPQVQQLGATNAAAPIRSEERSSISRDSGLMSPMDETLLNMLEPLEAMVNATATSDNANYEFETSRTDFTPVITCVTSLDPNASFIQDGKCSVCQRKTNLKCLGCNLLYYCCYECQQCDWSRHRHYCRARN